MATRLFPPTPVEQFGADSTPGFPDSEPSDNPHCCGIAVGYCPILQPSATALFRSQTSDPGHRWENGPSPTDLPSTGPWPTADLRLERRRRSPSSTPQAASLAATPPAARRSVIYVYVFKSVGSRFVGWVFVRVQIGRSIGGFYIHIHIQTYTHTHTHAHTRTHTLHTCTYMYTYT